jgi:hypothetical protein
VKFSELLKKIGRLITTDRRLPSGVMPHLYVRDQREVDAHLAKMGHHIERRHQAIPMISAADIFRHDAAATEAAFNRRRCIGRHMENNSDMLK